MLLNQIQHPLSHSPLLLLVIYDEEREREKGKDESAYSLSQFLIKLTYLEQRSSFFLPGQDSVWLGSEGILFPPHIHTPP